MSAAKKKRSIIHAWPLFVLLVLVIGGISAAVVRECGLRDESRAARDAFFDALWQAGPSEAYAELSAKRRAATTLAEFTAFAAHPALNEAGTYFPPEQNGYGVCLDGYVNVDGGDWYIQLFLVEEGEHMVVESIGLQQPTKVALGTLLDKCGFGSGTMMGYRGPAPISMD